MPYYIRDPKGIMILTATHIERLHNILGSPNLIVPGGPRYCSGGYFPTSMQHAYYRNPYYIGTSDPLGILGGSWVVISGVMSRVTTQEAYDPTYNHP